MQETPVPSLGWEDPLEKEIATHSSILAWRSPWTEEPGWVQSMGSQRVGHAWVTNTHTVWCHQPVAPAEESARDHGSHKWLSSYSNAQSLLFISHIPWPGVHFFSWQDLVCSFPRVVKREPCESWQMAGKSRESPSVHFHMIEFQRKKKIKLKHSSN